MNEKIDQKELDESIKKFTSQAFDEFIKRAVKALGKVQPGQPELTEAEHEQLKMIIETHIFDELFRKDHIRVLFDKALNFVSATKEGAFEGKNEEGN